MSLRPPSFGILHHHNHFSSIYFPFSYFPFAASRLIDRTEAIAQKPRQWPAEGSSPAKTLSHLAGTMCSTRYRDSRPDAFHQFSATPQSALFGAILNTVPPSQQRLGSYSNHP